MKVRERWRNSHLHWLLMYSQNYQPRVATTIYRVVVLALLVVIAVRV